MSANRIRLRKMLYGMVDSPKRWNEELDDKLVAFGLTRSTTDPGHYYNNMTKLHLVVHVDDGIYAGPEIEMKKFENYMQSKFELKPDMADVYCGVNIEQTDDYIKIHQIPLIHELVEEFLLPKEQQTDEGMNFHTYATPMEVKLRLTPPTCKTQDPAFEDLPYRRLVGRLIWIAMSTRPDIAYVAKELAKFGSCYNDTTYKYAKRVVRYLWRTRFDCITYRKPSENIQTWPPQTAVYSDASHAGLANDSRSTGGYITLVNGTPVAWKSKTERHTSLSSCESELKQLSQSMSHAIKIRETLHNFNLLPYETDIYVIGDNLPSVRNMLRPAGSSLKLQHMDKYFYFVQDYVNHGIKLEHTTKEYMYADILTKSLDTVSHEKWTSKLLEWDTERTPHKRLQLSHTEF